MKLSQRIRLIPKDRDWLNSMAEQHHYMRKPVHVKACPFGWAVEFDGELFCPDGRPCGFIMFSSPHFTKLAGVFGYPGLPTKWQALLLSRLWLHDDLPRNSESYVIGWCLRQKGHEHISPVQRRWLKVHPPKFMDEPYHVRAIVSYADTRYHSGTIYLATNFTDDGEAISRRRHKNTRGEGSDGAVLRRFVYTLDEPKTCWQPRIIQAGIFRDVVALA